MLFLFEITWDSIYFNFFKDKSYDEIDNFLTKKGKLRALFFISATDTIFSNLKTKCE